MPRSRSRWISLRRADRCANCGSVLPEGARSQWDPIGRSVWCVACGEPEPSAPPMVLELVVDESLDSRPRPSPGWRARARSWLADAPEATVSAALATRLDGQGVRLLENRRVPGSRRTLDDLAVGPGGVTVIAAAPLPGEVRVMRVGGPFGPRTEGLRIGGSDHSALVEGVLAQSEAVRAVLASTGQGGVEVAGAVCIMSSGGLPYFGQLRMRGVVIDDPRGVANLAGRGGPLGPAAVERIWLSLAARLPG